MAFGIPLLVAIVYAVFLYLVSDAIHHMKKFHQFFINVTTGLMFSYMFLHLLPDVFLNAPEGLLLVSAFFLFAGYIGFYLAEKRAYSKKLSYRRTHLEILAIKTGGFYLIHFITGYLIVYTFAENNDLFDILFLLIPFTFHVIATSLLYEDLHKWSTGFDAKILMPLLIVMGAFAAVITTMVFGVSLYYFYLFFAGTFIYLVTTIVTPEYKHGHVTYFLLGIFLYFALLMFGG